MQNYYGVTGKKEEALKALKDLTELSKMKYVPPFHFAWIYVGLGDKDQAFEWQEKALEQRHPYLILINVEPVFESLHSDSRYAELLRKVGLPR